MALAGSDGFAIFFLFIIQKTEERIYSWGWTQSRNSINTLSNKTDKGSVAVF